jgi:hypothetical protein
MLPSSVARGPEGAAPRLGTILVLYGFDVKTTEHYPAFRREDGSTFAAVPINNDNRSH